MQFRHPELLYALFLLIIPILVHLFQLRKFKKEAFTNVAFLKKINIQTRKSNTIKKLLVMLTRMAALAMIILAFAQPFFTLSDSAVKAKETVIYLDNSFSMQAKGSAGPLLKQSIQDLIKNVPEDTQFSLITNDRVFKNTRIKNIRQELLTLPYTASQLSQAAIALKAQNEFSDDPSTEKRLVLISDFQDKGQSPLSVSEDYKSYIVQLTPATLRNTSIDSVYVTKNQSNTITLAVLLSSSEKQESNIPVSLYNGEILVAKGTASFRESLETTVKFDVQPEGVFEGKLIIEDPDLNFDNSLYFSFNSGTSVKVLSINESDDRFLARIFSQPDFEYTGVLFRNLDYSTIADYNLIVLNEVGSPSVALVNALSAFAKAGGTIVIIPNQKSEPSAYSTLLTTLGGMSFSKINTTQRLITTINYDHPLYTNVFENRIKNFQYPRALVSFNLNGGDRLLTYEDGAAFLATRGNTYVFTSALSEENSNFKNSPLIVPTLFNVGKQSLNLPELYFTIGKDNVYDIPISLGEDAILNLSHTERASDNLIPLQQSFATKVRVTTGETPAEAGIYNVKLKDSVIQRVSYNYDRSESVLRYLEQQPQEGISYTTSIITLFDNLKAADDVQSLWKWFVIFALGFLLLEMLILKFLK
ncbi:hypothetical protein EAX61_08155 [Dokdonia sinensis]|uniref:Aerotolerance regulator N-terminal domain-containing protein n=1 Tax=Dokdonia sinensis TaxID=2479847 RepID=A0A3M0G629_9FLAO|nr:BatA domain-containing protein [Dokdonia sinensis]RMB59547.1 hypothetical protein EAX61_08155 [Dokdonia sinensis]